VTKNTYFCGREFDTELLRPYCEECEKIGKLHVSTKEAVISIVEGDFEQRKAVFTSGIGGQHSKGGTSANRLRNEREEEIDFFFKRIREHMKEFKVDK
jgi:peptide subunit release factor 1 (eRF1)